MFGIPGRIHRMMQFTVAFSAVVLITIAIVAGADATQGQMEQKPSELALPNEAAQATDWAAGAEIELQSLTLGVGAIEAVVIARGRTDLGPDLFLEGGAFLIIDDTGARIPSIGRRTDGRTMTIAFPLNDRVGEVAHVELMGLVLAASEEAHRAGRGVMLGSMRLRSGVRVESVRSQNFAGAVAGLGPGEIEVTDLRTANGKIVLRGFLRGFAPEAVPAIDLLPTRLVLESGETLDAVFGRWGFGANRQQFEFHFNRATRPSGTIRLVTTLSLDEAMLARLGATGIDAARTAGATAAIPLQVER